MDRLMQGEGRLKEMPTGLVIVVVLTFLSIFPLGLMFLLACVASVVGMGGGLPLTLNNLWYYLPLFFGLFAFLSSISIFRETRSKFLWGSLIAYWVVLFVYFLPITIRIWTENSTGEYAGFQNLEPYQIQSLIAVLIPHIYAIGCTVHFLLSKNVHQYFDIRTKKA